MNDGVTIAAMCATLVVYIPAYSNPAPPPVVKRQMIPCMTQQMSVSKTISYNEAARVCADVAKPTLAALAGNATKPGTAH